MDYKYADITSECLNKISQYENELKEITGDDIVLVAFQENKNKK